MKNCYNSETNKILKVAEKEMLSCHHPSVGTEHLLLALLSTNNRLKDILLQNNLSYSKCKNEVNKLSTIKTKTNIVIYTPLFKRLIMNDR